jgi:TonB family protein
LDVTDIIRDRRMEPAGLQRMVVVSAAVHVMLFISVVFLPGGLLSRVRQDPRTVMTITLGGSGEGVRTGGMTSIGGRPVQTTEPAERKEPVRPPAAKVPEMTLPAPKARTVKASPAPLVQQAPDQARGRTPTRGAEVSAGSAIADTGARGQGFGLTSGGGAGSGSFLDVANFCCPDYLVTMISKVRSNWNQQTGTPGVVIVKFTIQRDGRLTDVMLEQAGSDPIQNVNAQRAVLVTRMLPALPAEFPNPTLTVHLSFQYQ